MAKDTTQRKQRDAHVPTDSFADIAFLLIIFFILAASLAQVKGVQSDMPAGEQSESKQEQPNTVTLQNGQIQWNGKVVSLEALRAELAALGLTSLPEDSEDRIILFEPLGNEVWQDYFGVLSAISAAGGEVFIVTEEE